MKRKIYTPDEIKFIREACGDTQEEFASRIGVSFTQVNRWENDKAKPNNLSTKAIQRIERQTKRAQK